MNAQSAKRAPSQRRELAVPFPAFPLNSADSTGYFLSGVRDAIENITRKKSESSFRPLREIIVDCEADHSQPAIDRIIQNIGAIYVYDTLKPTAQPRSTGDKLLAQFMEWITDRAKEFEKIVPYVGGDTETIKAGRDETLPHQPVNNHQMTREHICSQCPRVFVQIHNLIEHSKTHIPDRKKDFFCQNCEKRFFRKSDLTRHHKIHDRNVGVSCRHCPRVCKRRDTMDR